MTGFGEVSDRAPFTIFTVPKAFADAATACRQRDAISSWAALAPAPDLLIFGDDDGIKDLRYQLGLRTVPSVAVDSTGIPIVSELFAAAEEVASHRHLCYVNSDIVLFDDFPAACSAAWTWRPDAILIGSRHDVDNYASGGATAVERWAARVSAIQAGEQTCMGTDYCAYPRGVFSAMPPFAIGRTAFDNWLIWRALDAGRPLVDLSEVVAAVHVRHRAAGEWESFMATSEVARNRELATLWQRTFTVADCSHRWTSSGVRSRRAAALRHRFTVMARIVESRLRGERWF
jgi:hypothetical protein